MKRLPTLITLLISLTVAGAASAQFADDYRFQGTVKDTDGNPLTDVTIEFKNVETGKRIVFETKDDGSFDRRMIPHAVYSVRFEKDGYATREERFNWTAIERKTIVKTADIVLESEEAREQRMVDKARAELTQKAAVAYEKAYHAMAAGDCATATSEAQSVLGMGAGDFEYAVRFVLARCLATADDLETAAAEYEKVIALKPDLFEAQFDLGGVRQRLERYEEALEAFAAASALKPEHAELHYNMGAILFQLSRYSEARPHLEKTLELNPDHTHANKALGFVLLADEAKDMARAKQLLQHYLDLEPNAGDAAQIQQIVANLPG